MANKLAFVPVWLSYPSLGSSVRKTDWLAGYETLNWALRVFSGLDERKWEATKRRPPLTSHYIYRPQSVLRGGKEKAWNDTETKRKKYQDRGDAWENNSVAFSLCVLVVWRRCVVVLLIKSIWEHHRELIHTHKIYYNQPQWHQGKKKRICGGSWFGLRGYETDPTKGEFHAARKMLTVAAATPPPSCFGSGSWLRLGLRCQESG